MPVFCPTDAGWSKQGVTAFECTYWASFTKLHYQVNSGLVLVNGKQLNDPVVLELALDVYFVLQALEVRLLLFGPKSYTSLCVLVLTCSTPLSQLFGRSLAPCLGTHLHRHLCTRSGLRMIEVCLLVYQLGHLVVLTQRCFFDFFPV